MVVARFKDVSKKFGAVTALANLSLEIRRGEILAFLGPNGAGKSTSLKLLTGLRSASGGAIELFGQSPQSAVARQRVGMTPQELDFPPHLKVHEVLELVALAYGQCGIQAWKERLDLGPLWERKTQGLSGGEKRRLGLACALLGKPELLLLDEPTTGLDVEARRALWDVIRQEKSRGTTICLTTHYLDEVEALADRVIVIDQGEKLFEGSVDEIRRRVEVQKIEWHANDETERALQEGRIPCLSFERKGAWQIVFARESDETIRALVRENLPFHHLTVYPASLEEAFLQVKNEARKLEAKT